MLAGDYRSQWVVVLKHFETVTDILQKALETAFMCSPKCSLIRLGFFEQIAQFSSCCF